MVLRLSIIVQVSSFVSVICVAPVFRVARFQGLPVQAMQRLAKVLEQL
jgi:hypothetical protein